MRAEVGDWWVHRCRMSSFRQAIANPKHEAAQWTLAVCGGVEVCTCREASREHWGVKEVLPHASGGSGHQSIEEPKRSRPQGMKGVFRYLTACGCALAGFKQAMWVFTFGSTLAALTLAAYA